MIAVPERLRVYVQYIRNTGRIPLETSHFDEDWEPVGPRARRDMAAAGLIVESDCGITLQDDVE